MKKADELESVLLANNVDMACVTETWLKDVIRSDVVSISGYVIHRNDRSNGRRGGGVAVFVRQDIPCERLTTLEAADVESVWLLYRTKNAARLVSRCCRRHLPPAVVM